MRFHARAATLQGRMKEEPVGVPEKNPGSGQPNSFYGWLGKGGARKQE
jgi:hypothetical protein